MNLPEWLGSYIDSIGSRRLSGEITRQEAIRALRDVIAEKDDRPLILGIYAEFAAKHLDTWYRDQQRSPLAGLPGSPSHVQQELFPDLPPRLYIRPGVSKQVMAMNAADWDNARNVIQNRTEHAIEGAKSDWTQFEDAFTRVRPLLTGNKTTADVVRQLRGEDPLEGLA